MGRLSRTGLALAVLLLAWGPTATSAEGEKVVIAQGTDSTIFMVVYVAKAKGYFKEEGIDAEISILPGGPQAVAAVLAGDAQVYNGIPSVAMKAMLKGQDLKVFAGLLTQVPTHIVIQGEVAKRKGITASTPPRERMAALRGLTLGVNAVGASPDQVLRYALTAAGVDPTRDVVISPVGAGTAILGSFEHKRIDGFAFGSPISDIAVTKLGGVKLIDFARGDDESLRDFLYLGLIAKPDWLKANPRRAAALVRAVWKAEKLIAVQPDEAREAARTLFPKMDPQAFKAGFDSIHKAIPTSPFIQAIGIEQNRKFLKGAEGVDFNLDLSKLYTNEYVEMAQIDMK